MNRRTVIQSLLAFFGWRGWGMQQKQAWREQLAAIYGTQPRVRTCCRFIERDADGVYEWTIEVVPVSQINEGSVYHVPRPMVGILEHATFSTLRTKGIQ